jgi:hypothetical protein
LHIRWHRHHKTMLIKELIMSRSTTNSKTWQEKETEMLEILSQVSKLDKLSKRLDEFKPEEYEERYKNKERE